MLVTGLQYLRKLFENGFDKATTVILLIGILIQINEVCIKCDSQVSKKSPKSGTGENLTEQKQLNHNVFKIVQLFECSVTNFIHSGFL